MVASLCAGTALLVLSTLDEVNSKSLLSCGFHELFGLDPQKTLSITMGDSLSVGRAHRELVQEIAC